MNKEKLEPCPACYQKEWDMEGMVCPRCRGKKTVEAPTKEQALQKEVDRLSVALDDIINAVDNLNDIYDIRNIAVDARAADE